MTTLLKRLLFVLIFGMITMSLIACGNNNQTTNEETPSGSDTPVPPVGGDTDFDGVNNNVDNCPTVANDNQLDSDGDGLSDKMEDKLGTDKHNSDTDGDGFKDGGEVVSGYSPLQ